MVKVDGSRRLALRNRRFVRVLDPRKTSLEDHQPTTSATPPQMLGSVRMRQNAMTPPSWSPPSSRTPTPAMTIPPEPTELARDTEEPRVEDKIPAQTENSDDQHGGRGGHPACVEHDEEAPPIGDPDGRLVRKGKPNMRYPATEFDLNSVRTRSTRTPRRAK